MLSTPQEFNYNISKTKLIVLVIIVSALPFLFASIATDNYKGLRLFRIVTLSPNDATLFYWGLVILCSFAALTTILMVLTSLRHPKKVELYATHANLPKASIFGGQLNIPYKSITNISQRKISATQEMAVIKSTVGESRLIASYFKGIEAYQDFLSALSAKIRLVDHPASRTN